MSAIKTRNVGRIPAKNGEALDAMRDHLAKVVDLMVDVLTLRLLDRVVDKARYYDQNTAPCPKRKYLEAARRGEFESFKNGKQVLARAEVVHAWLATPRTKPVNKSNDVSVHDDEAELLEKAGIRKVS